MVAQDFEVALEEARARIKDAVGRLKATAAGYDAKAWAALPCLPGCIKCDSSCIAKSACDDMGCPNTCIAYDKL